MAKKKRSNATDKIVIEGGYIRTKSVFTSSEVTRGTGTHKDKKKDKNRKACRTRVNVKDYSSSACYF